MPWTPSNFRSRHNHKLSDKQADEASRVANALLRKYGDEGKAIRIANSVVEKADGGDVALPDEGSLGYPSSLHHVLPYVAAGFPEMWGSEKNGKLALGVPGAYYNLRGLPALVGIHGKGTDEAVKRGGDIADATYRALGISPPSTPVEHFSEAAGQMLAQLPVPEMGGARAAALASRYLSKVPRTVRAALGPLAEWFSPTVHPSLKNYGSGTAVGGSLGTLADYLSRPGPAPDPTAAPDDRPQGPDLASAAFAEEGHAEGGKIKQFMTASHYLGELSDEALEWLGSGVHADPDKALTHLTQHFNPSDINKSVEMLNKTGQSHLLAGAFPGMVASPTHGFYDPEAMMWQKDMPPPGQYSNGKPLIPPNYAPHDPMTDWGGPAPAGAHPLLSEHFAASRPSYAPQMVDIGDGKRVPTVGMFAENTPDYVELMRRYGFDPRLTHPQYDDLLDWAKGKIHSSGSADEEPRDAHLRLNDIIRQHQVIMPPHATIYKGLGAMSDDDWQPSERWPSPTAFSLNPRMSEGFVQGKTDPYNNGKDTQYMLRLHNPRGVLPLPISGESEFLLPGDGEGRMQFVNREKDPETGITMVDAERYPFSEYAKGGSADDSPSERAISGHKQIGALQAYMQALSDGKDPGEASDIASRYSTEYDPGDDDIPYAKGGKAGGLMEAGASRP